MSNALEDRLKEAESLLLDSIHRIEAILDELEPEEAAPHLAATTPTLLERLAAVIRELPGNWH